MPVLVPHGVGVAAVAGATAPGTGNFHIGQKLHVQTDDAGAVTDLSLIHISGLFFRPRTADLFESYQLQHKKEPTT